MANLSDGRPDGVSFFLIFFALIFGFITLPCSLFCEAVVPDYGKDRYYPGCGRSSTSYMCEKMGYKWDGTYKQDRGIVDDH